MKPELAKIEFENYLKKLNLQTELLSIQSGFEAFFEFYKNVRADGCLLEFDGDMLLYQWGIYDWGWGDGSHFDLNLTRQLIFGGEPEDDNIWQLSLSFLFEPNEELKKLGQGYRWGSSVEYLDAFREFIVNSDAYKVAANYLIGKVKLNYDCAG